MRHLAVFLAALMVSHTVNSAPKPIANLTLTPKLQCDTSQCSVMVSVALPETHPVPIRPLIDFTVTDCDKNTLRRINGNWLDIFPGTEQSQKLWGGMRLLEDGEEYAFGLWVTGELDLATDEDRTGSKLSSSIAGGEILYGEPVWWSKGCREENN